MSHSFSGPETIGGDDDALGQAWVGRIIAGLAYNDEFAALPILREALLSSTPPNAP